MKLLFIGRTTLDLIYQVNKIPDSNTKKKADAFTQAAGGPACNAAVIAAHLGAEVDFFTCIGKNPLSKVIRKDLSDKKINIIDFTPEEENLAVSSIMIENNGNRTVIGSPLHKINISKTMTKILPNNLAKYEAILWDGYYPEILIESLKRIKKKPILILDADRWHPHLPEYKKDIDIVIAGESFPDLNFLKSFKIGAITQGENGIKSWTEDNEDLISVKEIKPIDTLGAGDFFHGAFTFYYSQNKDLNMSLKLAGDIASESCLHYGTRSWLKFINP